MRVKKGVITAAGLGTRMKHVTNFVPKALLPLFGLDHGKRVLRPMIDLILQSEADIKITRTCCVLSRRNRLTRDALNGKSMTFCYQKVPNGFGGAVLCARNFVGPDAFFLSADDGLLIGGYRLALRLFEETQPDGVLMVRRVLTPSRYGIVYGTKESTLKSHKVLRVERAEEKPKRPQSNLALIAAYVMQGRIMRNLQNLSAKGDTLELTSAIQQRIDEGGEFLALETKSDSWLSIGDPENYFRSLSFTYENPGWQEVDRVPGSIAIASSASRRS